MSIPDTSRRRPAIAVVGDGDVPPGARAYQVAKALGEWLVVSGFRVVTGGLGGVMEAASSGARAAKAYQSGDVIGVLPGHDGAEANPFVDIALPTGLGHGRNLVVAHADAVVAIGGGAGTLSEMAFAWIHRRLIIALRGNGWSGRLADTRIDERVRFADIADDRVFGVDNPEDAVALLRSRLSEYVRARR
jgi:uncharacterized protein (TIGR00725 family)